MFSRNPDSNDREVQLIPGSEMTVSRFAQLLRTTLALEKIDLLKKKVNSSEEKLIEAMIKQTYVSFSFWLRLSL